MATAKIKLESIKDSDGWMGLAYDLCFGKFKDEHSDLEEDDLHEKFQEEVVYPKFKYGEFASLEIEFDENFNIVGGKIL